MKNVGNQANRLSDPINYREAAFAELWDELCERGQLEYLLAQISGRDRMVAATVIQWLGSNCGQYFLKQVNERCGGFSYEMKCGSRLESNEAPNKN